MRSMTGYGEATCVVGASRFVVSVRSLNHRFLDIRVRLPWIDPALEAEIHGLLRLRLSRGAVTLEIRNEKPMAPQEVVPDLSLAEGYLRALTLIRDHLRLEDAPTLGLIATLPGVLGVGPPGGCTGKELFQQLAPAVEEALTKLNLERDREGKAIADEVRRRVGRLQDLVSRVVERTRDAPRRCKERLEARLLALGQPGVDAWRLAQEVALFADRCDATEELERLGVHFRALLQLLDDEGAAGRRIDFLLQEIGRETNTLASKAQDAEVSQLVVEMKAELEKIREQIQNVE